MTIKEGGASTVSSKSLSGRVAASVVAAVVLTIGVLGVTASPANADVVVGQRYPTKDLHCGGQDRVTGSVQIGPLPLRQRSWIYYNCSDKTVRRKAGRRLMPDWTPCKAIRPGEAIVLMSLWTAFGAPSDYTGSVPCR